MITVNVIENKLLIWLYNEQQFILPYLIIFDNYYIFKTFISVSHQRVIGKASHSLK